MLYFKKTSEKKLRSKSITIRSGSLSLVKLEEVCVPFTLKIAPHAHL